MSIITLVQAALGALTLIFGIQFFKDAVKNKDKMSDASWTLLNIGGAVINFFDTLGVGSFAPSTAFFRFTKTVPDRLLPGTLNVSMSIPVVIEAFIFITVIKVEPITLISMIIAATLGAVMGAGIVAKLPEKKVQMGMGFALLVVAFIILAGLLKLMPSGGDAIGLEGGSLVVAVVGNFILGALMTIGIGQYAPCMALVYSLGMSPRVAFPIMMASSAFLMPAASIKFVKEGAYDIKASIAFTIAGSIGVLIAAYIITELPIIWLKWLVVCVIFYTSATLLRSASKKEELKKSA